MAKGGTTDYNELFPVDGYSQAIKLLDQLTNSFITSLSTLKGTLSATNKASITELKELKATLEGFTTKKIDLNTIFVSKDKANESNSAVKAQREAMAALVETQKLAASSTEQLKTKYDLLKKSYDSLAPSEAQNWAQLKGLREQLVLLGTEISNRNKELATAKKAVDVAAGSYKAMSNELGALKTQLRDMPNAFNPVSGALNKSNKEAVELQSKISTLDNALKKADSSMGNYHRNVGNYTGAVTNFGKELLAFSGVMLGIAGVFQAASFVKDANVQYERLTSSLKVISKTTVDYDRNLQFLKDTTEELGLDFFKTGDAFKNFAASAAASGFSFQSTRDVFYSVSQAGAKLKLSSEQMTEALFALSQMASKGKVEAQELRLQLGNALPGANALAAKALGVTTAEMEKMLKAGEILSNDFLPKFAKELDKAFGGGEKHITGLIAETNRWNNALTQIAVDPSGGLNGVLAKIVSIGTQTLKATDLMFKYGLTIGGITKGVFNESIDKASIESDLKKEQEFSAKKKENREADIQSLIKDVATREKRVDDLKALSKEEQEQANLDSEVYALNQAQHQLRRFSELNEEDAFFKLSIKQRKEYVDKLADEYTKQATIAEKSNDRLDKIRAANSLQKFNNFSGKINDNAPIISKEEQAAAKKEQAGLDREAKLDPIKKLEEQIDKLNLKLKENALSWADAGKDMNKFKPDQSLLDQLDKLNAKLAFAKSGGANTGKDDILPFKQTSIPSPTTPSVAIPKSATSIIDPEILARKYSFSELIDFELEAEKKHQEDMVNVYKESISIKRDLDKQDAARKRQEHEVEKQIVSDLVNGIGELYKSASQEQINILEQEKNVAVETAGSNKNARLAIEADYNKKILAEKRKQAKIDKEISLFNIGLKTAEGVMAVASTGGGTYFADFGISFGVLSALVLAQGLVQAALVLAKPLPSYAVGTGYAHEGPAIVGEKGFEIIEENGSFRATGNQAHLTHLKEGAKVFTHEQSKQMLYSDRVLNNIKTEGQMQYFETSTNKIRENKILDQASVMQIAIANSSRIDEKTIANAIANAIKEMPVRGIGISAGQLTDYIQQGSTRTNILNKTLP